MIPKTAHMAPQEHQRLVVGLDPVVIGSTSVGTLVEVHITEGPAAVSGYNGKKALDPKVIALPSSNTQT